MLHQHFLVIGLDEGVAGASGCSIDASVRFVAQLEQLLGLELLEKSRLAFLHEGAVQLLERRALKDRSRSGTIAPDTLYFDNTLATKAANWMPTGPARRAKPGWPATSAQQKKRRGLLESYANVVLLLTQIFCAEIPSFGRPPASTLPDHL